MNPAPSGLSAVTPARMLAHVSCSDESQYSESASPHRTVDVAGHFVASAPSVEEHDWSLL